MKASANPKFVHLLQSLLEGTRRGSVKWEKTISKDDFRVSLEGAFVRVGRVVLDEEDLDEASDTYATLVTLRGETLEYVYSHDLEPEHPALVQELLSTVRRQVMQVDDILDRLIQRVESGKAG
jgi:hypothetical protein